MKIKAFYQSAGYNVDGMHDARQFIFGHLQKIFMMIFRDNERMAIMDRVDVEDCNRTIVFEKKFGWNFSSMILQKIHAIVSLALSGEKSGIPL